MIGRVLGGRYEVQKRLGGGGMSVVYKAIDTYLHRPVSVKSLRPQFTSDSDFVRRFRREALAVASLSHPNIVGIYDVGHQEETYYIVMEYVEGETLRDRIAREGALPADEAVRIAVQILDALEHAHENGIIHRDIKPHNVLLTRAGRVKVTDFGIARAVSSATVEQSTGIIGSAHYISPEQARGQQADERSDLYSLGIVLYEMLTGQRPFQGEHPLTVAMQHVEGEMPRPRKINPAVPKDLEALVLKAVAREPSRRYASAQDFRRALENWQKGGSFVAGTTGGGKRAGGDLAPAGKKADWYEPDEGEAPRRVRRWVWPVVVLILLAIGAGSVYWLAQWLKVPDVTVPDVRGYSLVDAQQELTRAGLEYQVTQRNDDQAPAGAVIDQEPAPREVVKQGRSITLTVSLGPEFIEGGTPNVLNRHRLEARNLLLNAGLDVDFTEEFDDTVPADYVISQDPGPRSQIQRGATVEVVVSKGREPVPFDLPDLRGRPLGEARDILANAGLIISRESGRLAGYPEGTVVGQTPAAGTTVKAGDEIELVVSQGCEQETTQQIEVRRDGVEIRVVLTDEEGERVIHEEVHDEGSFEVPVCWSGAAARLMVYADDEWVDSRILTR